MKLRENISHVNTNIEGATPFTIKTSAKAFKILSDNLYSDKPTAIIRELSCNAYDSHVAAGKEKTPFEIHLPTEMQPWLSVKDYGVGMSHEVITNLYTSYFDSDKTDSNEVTGALGLGSKSPFAYTDIFSVTSIYEGKKGLYSCFIAKDGTPNITMMDESNTDESNSIEVKLSVKSEDCDDFCYIAGEVLSVFKTKPKVTGTFDLRFSKPDNLYKGRAWRLRRTGSGSARALQGNVAYKIDYTKLTNPSEKQMFVAQNKFDIDFEIGELDVAASREDLSYDDLTIKNIKKKLDKVCNSFEKMVSKKLDECKTLWEAKLFVKKAHDLLTATGYLPFCYKGNKISSDSFSVDNSNMNLAVVLYEDDGWRGNILRSDLTKRNNITVKISEKSVFIVNDDNRRGISRTRNLIKLEKKSAYLIEGDYKRFLKEVGNPPFKMASSLPAPAKGTYDYNGRDYKKVYMPIKYGYDFSIGSALSYDELPDNKKIFYVATKRNYIYAGDNVVQHSTSQKWFQTADDLKIIPKGTVVYGISTWNIKSKKIANKKQFVEFSAFLKKKVKSEINKAKAAAMEYSKNVANYKYIMEKRYLYDKILGSQRIASLDSSSKIFELKRKYKEIVDTYNESLRNKHVKTVIDLSREFFGSNIDVKHDDIERIEDVYPMIAAVQDWHMIDHMKEIIAYIKLVDRSA